MSSPALTARAHRWWTGARSRPRSSAATRSPISRSCERMTASSRPPTSASMRDGRGRGAYLGIAGGPRPLPPRIAASLGRKRGVEAVEVVPDSPAGRAGLRPEDLIVALDDVAIAGVDDVQRLMTDEAIGR